MRKASLLDIGTFQLKMNCKSREYKDIKTKIIIKVVMSFVMSSKDFR